MGSHTAPARPAGNDASLDPLVEAFLSASRVLVAVAARSLAAGDAEITLSQYRTLVLLGSRGPQRTRDLAGLLAVTSSTATRQCERLERRGLVHRVRSSTDRRAVLVSISEAGMSLVRRVTVARRAEIAAVLQAMAPDRHDMLLHALREFADAAGEVPEQNWSLGWTS